MARALPEVAVKLVVALVVALLAGCDRFVDLSRRPDAAPSTNDGGIDAAPVPPDSLVDAAPPLG